MHHADAETDNCHVGTFAPDPRLAERNREIGQVRHLETAPVENFVFKEDHRVAIADCGFQQPFRVGRRIGHHHLQPRHLRIPGGVVLAVLRTNPRRCAIGAAKHDRAAHLPARHVERLCCRVYDVVNRLHGEVEGHEFENRAQSGKGRPNRDARKAVLGNRRIDHPARTKLVEKPLADLVGALIFAHLFAHQIHGLVARHFLGHCFAQGFAHGHGFHRRARRPIGRWRCHQGNRRCIGGGPGRGGNRGGCR